MRFFDRRGGPSHHRLVRETPPEHVHQSPPADPHRPPGAVQTDARGAWHYDPGYPYGELRARAARDRDVEYASRGYRDHFGDPGRYYGNGEDGRYPESFDRDRWMAERGIPGVLERDVDRYGAYGERVRRGVPPRAYQRTDERVQEDIYERLSDPRGSIDAEHVVVSVQNGGVVTLTGTVEHRHDKWAIEDLCVETMGVREVNNQLRVKSRGDLPDSGYEAP